MTPAVLLDGPTLARNIESMAARAAGCGVELWPHVKTHKSTRIAELQREHGASGFTVATLREAECLADSGFERVLVAYPPVGPRRLERLLQLARRIDVRVVLDSLQTAAELDAGCARAGVRIPYLWEVDSGAGRTGTAPGPDTATLVAQAVDTFGNVDFDGLMTFGGHAYAAADDAAIGSAAADEKLALSETLGALEPRGLDARARSAGNTPTSSRLEDAGPITEIRPGNYVFNDATQVALGVATEKDCALSVLATVLSRPDPRRLILDCGSKALAAERLTPKTIAFGLVAGHPELVVERLYEEHAIVTSPEPTDIALGSRLRVVPNHSCATTNLHDRVHVIDDGEIVDVWSVDARGWEPEQGT
jgi:D-serine deaminase-like pyridoxal phosphate-dependent protein